MQEFKDTGKFSILDFFNSIRFWGTYLKIKRIPIIVIAVLGGILGIAYAWVQKPVYTAELSFATESDNGSKMGSYAGIAAQFGIDIGGAGESSMFEGENLIEFLRSRKLVEKTLFTNVDINGSKVLLIDYYMKVHEFRKSWKKSPELMNVKFDASSMASPLRARDSVLNGIETELIKALKIEKVDKKLTIVVAQMMDNDELFAKVFVESLTSNAISYYVEYKSKKARQNVDILQFQLDSIKALLNGNIHDIATGNDLNINPIKQQMRVGTQRTQIDAQTNGAVYTELVKNLELARISLRKETPLIQVIDAPRLPLIKKKMGRLKGAILFGFLFTFMAVTYFIFSKILKDLRQRD